MKVLACIVLALASIAQGIEEPTPKESQEKRGVVGFGYGAYNAPSYAAAPLPYGKFSVATPALAYTSAPAAVSKFAYATPALQYAAAPALTYATAPAYAYPAPAAVTYAAAPAFPYAPAAPAVAKLVTYAAPAAYAPHALPYAAPPPVGYGLGYGVGYGVGYGPKYLR